jgi:hypothetical protein
MKTAGRENQYRWAAKPKPSTWRGRSEQILLKQVGCEARKTPVVGDVFLLDFYLYRTYRELATIAGQIVSRDGFPSRITDR